MISDTAIEVYQPGEQATALTTAGGPRALDLAVAAWLDSKGGLSGSTRTRRAYADALTAFYRALEAAHLTLTSDPRAVALAAQGWAGQGAPAASSYNQRLACVSSFYAFVIKRGLLPVASNPIDLVERRKVQAYAGAAPLDARDVANRLVTIDRSGLAGARDYALLHLALQTGRRLAEVAGLQWGDLTLLPDGRLRVHFRRCKGGKVMTDVLTAEVGAAVLTWLYSFYGADLGGLAATAPLWVSLADNGTRGGRLSERGISRLVADRLGVSKVHALRHTVAVTMERAGAPVSLIQKQLGHSSLATTGVYLAALDSADGNPYAGKLAAVFGLAPTNIKQAGRPRRNK